MRGVQSFLTAFGLLLVHHAVVYGEPLADPPSYPHCEQPVQRKAWHTLSEQDKHAYLEAELCLLNVPATINEQLVVAKTLFQALQEQHQLQYDHIHEVGGFLPYHRYMTWAHEHLLRTKCAYTGAQPWWDEERDASHFVNSSIFDAHLGFGGRAGGCVVDGPFANYTLIIGPGKNNTKHCLEREIDDIASQASASYWLEFARNATTFEAVWDRIEFYPHSAGHSGVGGEMSNPISSPGDPLFYLHHAFVDRLWWEWQIADEDTRLYAIGGPNVKDPNRPAPIPEGIVGSQQDVSSTLHRRHVGAGSHHAHEQGSRGYVLNDDGNHTTLAHKISLFGILSDVTAEDVMDIRNEMLCYEYI